VTSKFRAVFDTSVVVSAVLLPRSAPRQAFDRVQEQGKVLISAATVNELNEVLRRQRFDKYIREAQRLEFLAALIQEAELVDVTEVVTECRDPKDNKFLELAVSGKATYIISGDKDLLALHPFRGIPVIAPQVFLLQVWPERTA
jgi:putative PIN family toxin of toxin-antitoxin system